MDDKKKKEVTNIEYEKFFSANLDLLCIADLEGCFIKVNKSWENLLGYSTDELQGKRFLDYVHPDDISLTLEAISDLEEDKPVNNFINRYRCQDNTYRYIEWKSYPYHGLIYAAARDISDKIEKQKIIEEKEENFRTFFETIDDLIFIVTTEGDIVHMNHSVITKLGYSLKELENMQALDLYPDYCRSEANRIIDDILNGLRDICPLPLRKKDGSLLFTESRLWKGKWNGADCIYGIAKDLTKQQEALEIFHKLFSYSPAIMALCNTSDRAFTEVNYEFLNKLGYTREEVLGKTSADLELFPDKKKYNEVIDELENTKHISNIELKVRKKDGEILIVLLYGEIIENQNSTDLLMVLVDNTEQRTMAIEIAEQRNYAQMLLNTVPSAVYTVDKDSIIISWNKRAEQITGYLKEEIIGKKCIALSRDNCRDKCCFKCNNLDQSVYNRQSTIYSKNGDAIYITKNVEVIRNHGGEAIGAIECFEDITERLRVEHLLRESEMQLAFWFNTMSTGVVFHDKAGKIIKANKAAGDILGLTVDQLMGLDSKDPRWKSIHEDGSVFEGDTHPAMISLKTGQKVANKVMGVFHPYKEQYRWININAFPEFKENESEPYRAYAMFEDITERKNHEAGMLNKENILTAVAASIKHLLDKSDYYSAVTSCFEILGKATNVDRVYLFRNTYDSNGQGSTSQIIEWFSETTDPQIGNLALQRINFKEIESFIERLKSGKPFYGIVREFSNPKIREMLEVQKIMSIVILPVIVREEFWGFVGFDDCKNERIWTEGEFSTLSAFANSLGSAIERSLVEEELDNAKIRMKAILDNLPFLAWLKDTESRYVETNKTFLLYCGKEKEEVIGKTDYDIWPLEFAEKYKLDDQVVMKTGEKLFLEEVLYKPDITWFETYKAPIYDSDGRVVGTTGISKNITERKHMISYIENQKNFLKQMLNAIPDFVFFKDRFSVYLGCNQAFSEKYIGLSEDEIVGKTDLDFIKNKEQAEAFRERDRVVLDSLESIVDEEIISMVDGTIINVETKKTPFYDETGKVSGLIAIARDISMRKTMQEKLVKAKEQAEAANIMKSQFLANMSHEIRTPMNGVIGFLDILQRTNLSSEQKELLREAKSASEILLYLINDILDFSKIEAGKLTIENTIFNLRAAIEDAVSIIVPKAYEKLIEIHMDIPPTIPEEIVGDPARLRQIINNLVSNAVKFTDKGEINIRVTSKEQKDNRVRIDFSVQDSGVGINNEVIGNLFKPFTQADSSMTRKFGGTGLGLAISRELVKHMNGEISVESKPGIGSIFSFYIYAQMSKKASKSKMLHGLRNRNLLIVDDNENSTKILRSYLESEGGKVFEADCVEKAITSILLNASTENKIDLALINHHMPGLDGYQLASTLQNIPSTKSVKLVILSADVENWKGNSVISTGISGFLTKPVKRDELINFIKATLNLKILNDEISQPLKENSPNVNNFIIIPKILLVEDNEMNRKIVVTMLKQKGYSCDIALDGLEAVKAVMTKNYDFIFMDCQMPVMDGYESTAKIREMESETGKHTTIIAMTANAMEGDRQKCIDAGMDNYISKPLNYEYVFKIIESYGKESKWLFSDLLGEYFDLFIADTGIDLNVASELYQDYLWALPESLKLIANAIECSDLELIIKQAHQLKGTSGNFRIKSIYNLSVELEAAAKNGELSKCINFISDITKAYQVLTKI